MAVNVEINDVAVSINHDELYSGDVEFNPFDVVDDKEIIDRIGNNTCDVGDAGETFKSFPVFLIAKSILEHSCQIIDDEIGQGKNPGKEKARVPKKTKFNFTLLVLRQIATELISYNNQTGPKVSHRTTVRILEKLQSYSWEGKAVLVLLAFAMEFRDFSRPLSNIHEFSDQEVDQSLAILQTVLVFTNSSSDVKQFQQQVHNEIKIFSDCIKTTLQVMEMVIKLQKLSSVYDKEWHSSSASEKALAVHSYWVIMATVACATKMTILTSYDEDNKLQDHLLEHYTGKLHNILDGLTKKLNALNEKAKLYWEMIETFTAPRNVTEVLLTMTKPMPQKIRDNAKKNWVEIDPIMKGKVVFIFVSSLNISDDEISLIKETQKRIDQDHPSKFCILWIPYSELNLDTDAKAKVLLSEKRDKISCYDLAVYSERPVAMRYIEEEWNYKGEIMLAVMNEHGIIESSFAAFDLLRHWGMEAFPFDQEAERRISEKFNWPKTVVSKIKVRDSSIKKTVTEVNEWIKDAKRYIFFFGGRDEDWKQKFQETIKSVEQYLNTNKETMISWFYIGKPTGKCAKENDGNVSSQFWSGVEKRFLEIEDNKKFETETKQIQALLSYKYQEGWVLLCKGPRAVMSGHGETMLKALEEFKHNLEKGFTKIDQKGNTFGKVFKDYHTNIIKENGAHCCEIQIQGFYGKPIEEKKCTECSTTMKLNLFYKCCHEGTPLAAYL